MDRKTKTLATVTALQLGLALGALPVSAAEAQEPLELEQPQAVDAQPLLAAQEERVQPGWHEVDGVWRYGDEGGSWHTGWLAWGGAWYYMDAQGEMLTGWQTVDGVRYSFGESGKLKTGWQLDGEGADAVWRHYTANGRPSTGWLSSGGAWYLMGDDGVMLTGHQVVNGVSYYLNPNGSMHRGWLREGDSWHYYLGSGAMATDWVAVGDSWYLMGADGVMRTGLVTQGDATYLLQDSGAMATGWQTVGDKRVHFGLNGALSKGVFSEGDAVYFCADDGSAAPEGWGSYDGQWYYVRGGGQCATGWTTVEGTRYHFGADGAMSRSWAEVDGDWYFFDNSGAQVIGWLDRNGRRFYLDPARGGAMATGWTKADGLWWWLDDDGALVRDAWIHDGWAWYHLDRAGQYQTGWQTIDGERHFFNPSGAAYQGWKTEGNSWMYLDEYGAPATGWLQLGWKWYHFDADGTMHEGWLTQGDRRWYFVPGEGYAVTMDYQEADGKTYVYGASSGERQLGWVGVWTADGSYKTCFCDPSTGVRTDGPRIIDGYAFTFDSRTGALQSQLRTLARFVDELVKICSDNAHGYDQTYRYNQYGDYDCSSLTITCLKKAGFNTGYAVYTGDMREEILGADEFRWLWWDEVGREGLRVGDVMLNEYHHTNVYLGNGEVANATGNEWGGAAGGEPGDQTGSELRIQPYYYYASGIDGVLRYVGKEGA